MIQLSSVIGAAWKVKAGLAGAAPTAANGGVQVTALSRLLACAGMAAVVLGFASTASAVPVTAPTVLYDNGPVDGTDTGLNINARSWQVSDSFTLSQNSTVTGMTFAVWVVHGFPLTSVDWGISTSPFADDGTATPTGSFLFNNGSWDIYSEKISFGPVNLAAGTYWVNLSHAVADGTHNVNWDVNGGPSSVLEANYSGFTLPAGVLPGSDTFQILGTADVPEPATWAMMMLGVFGVGAALRARRRQPTGPALA